MDDARGSGGFTLLELLLVISILAVLGSVAVVSYTGHIRQSNQRSTEAFLEELRVQIVLANATAGSINKIRVADIGNGCLAVSVYAAEFAHSFAENIRTAYPDATDIVPDDICRASCFSFMLPAPGSWSGSSFGTAGSATYTQTDNCWK